MVIQWIVIACCLSALTVSLVVIFSACVVSGKLSRGAENKAMGNTAKENLNPASMRRNTQSLWQRQTR